ncbi:MAG: hypothetical protein EXR98_20930 [Gemmataceae bacterium]|nr:hypothetical protein [Gemmataceae bacterium]
MNHRISIVVVLLLPVLAHTGSPSVPTMKLVREVAIPGDLLSAARVPGSDKLYVGGNNGKLHFIDLADAKPKPISWDAHVSYVSGLAWTGKYLISAGSDHQLIWWDSETRTKVRSIEAHPKKWIRAIALSPDGKWLASVGDDMICRLWEPETGKPIREMKGHEALTPAGLVSKLYACAFSPDSKHIATGDQIGHTNIWETATGKLVKKIEAPYFYALGSGHTAGGIRSLAFSPDGMLLAAGGNVWGDTSTIAGSKALVQIFDWKSGKKTHDFQMAKNNFIFERIRFHPKGSWLVAAGGAGSGQKMVFFDIQKKAVLHEAGLNTLVFDIVLDESATTLYGVGKGNAFQWKLQD